MKKPILITGCPRSGTRFASLMMREVFGMMVGHEIELGDGISDWRIVDPRFEKKKFKVILHQVRYPLDVINSLHTITEQSRIFMQRNIVDVGEMETMLKRCMKYWYYWVTEAERMAEYTYRVENVKDSLKKIGDLVEVKPDMTAFYRLPKAENSRKNHKSYADVVLNDLSMEDENLFNLILDFTKKLGY